MVDINNSRIYLLNSRWFLPAIALFICIISNPIAHFYGRFWGEEANYFFYDIYQSGFSDSLLYIYKGTLQITSNIALIIATRTSIYYAPLITSWIGTIGILYFVWIFDRWVRINLINIWVATFALACLLVSGQTYEVLSNSTNLQWIFSLTVLLIAFLPREELVSRRWQYFIVCLLGGLSGVPSCMLAPSMFLRAIVERSWSHVAMAAVLGVTALLQVYIIATSSLEARDPFRYSLFELTYISIVRPSLGIFLTQKGSQTLMSAAATHFPAALLAAMALGLLAGFLYFVISSPKLVESRQNIFILVLTSMYVAALNIAGSLSSEINAMLGIGGGRYYLVSFLCVLMIACIISAKFHFGRINIIGIGIFVAFLINISYNVMAGTTTRHAGTVTWQKQLDDCRLAKVRRCHIVTWPVRMGSEWAVDIDMGKVGNGRNGQ